MFQWLIIDFGGDVRSAILINDPRYATNQSNREVQEPFLQVRSFKYAVTFYPSISAQHLNWLVNH
jgi:hypothetical protein